MTDIIDRIPVIINVAGQIIPFGPVSIMNKR
jgi:hypothetical protein